MDLRSANTTYRLNSISGSYSGLIPKGKVHAIVGIVCGSIFGLVWILLGIFILIGMIASFHRP